MPLFTRTFRRLSIVAAAAIYLLILMGGVVRTTGSGLGCPDWPLCHGQVIPPLEFHAIIEYTHRVVALAASLAATAVTVMAFVQHRRNARIAAPISLMAVLLIVQIPLGGVVVVSELHPLLVATHMGIALLILGCLVTVAVVANGQTVEEPAGGTSRAVRTLLPLGLAALFLLLLAGALVVGSDATFACMGWPLCSGKLLPAPNDSPLIAVQMLHRYMVALVSILLAGLIAAILRQANPALRRWAILLGGLFLAQILVGAAQVWAMFPAALRVLHLAAAAAVWSTLVALAVRVYLPSTRP